MTKKDYVLIAKVIGYEIDLAIGNYETIATRALRETARALADKFAEENPRFDRARFLAACNVPVEETVG